MMFGVWKRILWFTNKGLVEPRVNKGPERKVKKKKNRKALLKFRKQKIIT